MSDFILPDIGDTLRYHTKWNSRKLQPYEEELFDLWNERNIRCSIEFAVQGPSLTRFSITPESKTSSRKILGLADYYRSIFNRRDVILYEHGENIYMDVPWPLDSVWLGDLLTSPQYMKSRGLPAAAGMSIGHRCVFTELTDAPAVLAAGVKGSGLTPYLHGVVMSMLLNRTPDDVELFLISGGPTDFGLYEPLPYCHVSADPRGSRRMLLDIAGEVAHRGHFLYENRCRSIYDYRGAMNHIILVIGEAGGLVSEGRDDILPALQRIANIGPACGVHLLMGTARPGILRPVMRYFPVRLCFRTATMNDSYTMIEAKGAEKLPGKGEFFYVDGTGTPPFLLQSAQVSSREIRRAVSILASNFSEEEVPETGSGGEMTFWEKLFSKDIE